MSFTSLFRTGLLDISYIAYYNNPEETANKFCQVKGTILQKYRAYRNEALTWYFVADILTEEGSTLDNCLFYYNCYGSTNWNSGWEYGHRAFEVGDEVVVLVETDEDGNQINYSENEYFTRFVIGFVKGYTVRECIPHYVLLCQSYTYTSSYVSFLWDLKNETFVENLYDKDKPNYVTKNNGDPAPTITLQSDISDWISRHFRQAIPTSASVADWVSFEAQSLFDSIDSANTHGSCEHTVVRSISTEGDCTTFLDQWEEECEYHTDTTYTYSGEVLAGSTNDYTISRTGSCSFVETIGTYPNEVDIHSKTIGATINREATLYNTLIFNNNVRQKETDLELVVTGTGSNSPVYDEDYLYDDYYSWEADYAGSATLNFGSYQKTFDCGKNITYEHHSNSSGEIYTETDTGKSGSISGHLFNHLTARLNTGCFVVTEYEFDSTTNTASDLAFGVFPIIQNANNQANTPALNNSDYTNYASLLDDMDYYAVLESHLEDLLNSMTYDTGSQGLLSAPFINLILYIMD
jgi:hypothetical protein